MDFSLDPTDAAAFRPRGWRPALANLAVPRQKFLWGGGVILSLMSLFFMFAPVGAPQFSSVTLSWDPYPVADLAGYKVHYGTISGAYDQIVDVGNTTEATIANLEISKDYFFVVTAYNALGIETPPSNEAATFHDNADLFSLAPSAGALTPAFASGSETYSIFVPNSTATLTLTPVTTDGAATVTVNGADVPFGSSSPVIALDPGSNTITTVVTARDRSTTKVYTTVATRLSLLESWRQTYFNTYANAGAAADSATPQNDGVTNLMKFATAMDPTKPGTAPGALSQSGSGLVFTYARNKTAASAGLIFTVEWNDTLAANAWTSAGVVESSVDRGATEQVTAMVPMGTGGSRFVRLVVTRP